MRTGAQPAIMAKLLAAKTDVVCFIGTGLMAYYSLLCMSKTVDIKEVRLSADLGQHPVAMVPEGGMSFEMEKYMKRANPEFAFPVGRILELNMEHDALKALHSAMTEDPLKAKDYAQLLMYQAQLMAQLPIEDPVAYTELVCKLIH